MHRGTGVGYRIVAAAGGSEEGDIMDRRIVEVR